MKGQPISFERVENICGEQSISKLKVSFTSPTHLVTRGRAPQEAPEFEHLIRAVLRRYSDLAALYGSGRPEMDYRSIVDAAKAVKIAHSDIRFFRRKGFSSRKGEETPSEGLLGNITYEGDMSTFMPYLIFGQWLHVGKQATFGMGRYRLELCR